MNWAWASSLDHIWRSPSFPMWLTLAVSGFFALVVLTTLLRADRSVANAALAVIALLSIGAAGAATVHGFGPRETAAPTESRPVHSTSAALPQLSCIDDLAGDAVLNACEKALFGSAESAAAAIAYAASQITMLTALGDVATANKGAGTDLHALRRAVERDRYGLMAYVLAVRDRCTPSACPVFRSLTDNQQIAINMNERVYEGLISRYAPSWNAPAQAASGAVAALPPSAPTGKPTNAEFPSSASTPPVSIMTPEPATGAVAPKPGAAPPSAPRPAAATTSPAQTAAKKQPPPPKRPPAAAPVQLTPSAPAGAATAATSNE